MVTFGTRNASADSVVPDVSGSEPIELTRISRLPFFNMGERIVIVGRRSLGMDSETSPYLESGKWLVKCMKLIEKLLHTE